MSNTYKSLNATNNSWMDFAQQIEEDTIKSLWYCDKTDGRYMNSVYV